MERIKKAFGRIGIAGMVLAAVGLAASLSAWKIHEAHANTMTPPYVQYEKLNVAAGAIITSDVVSVTGCDDVEVYADNSAGGSTRTLTVSVYASDGTTVLWTAPAASLTTGLRWAINFSRYASAQTASANSTMVPHMPGPKIGAVLSAAGAAVGSLAIYCR
jgi:hypothetical protein